jgi:tRNA threonylcarbamoyladenosine biosynthesis protein TsaB
MMVLGVDTTTYHGSIALSDDQRGLLGSVSLLSPQSYSRRLLPVVHWLLDQLSLGLEDLQGLAVSCGPGSFTGVRIGISMVQGIALAAGLPAVAVPTLEASALRAGVPGGLVCPLLEAGRGELYGALYETGDQGLVSRALLHPLVRRPAELLALVAEGAGGREVWFSGDPPESIPGGEEILGTIRGRWSGADRFIAPQVARLGQEALLGGDAGDPAELSAIYVRPSDAEITAGSA